MGFLLVSLIELTGKYYLVTGYLSEKTGIIIEENEAQKESALGQKRMPQESPLLARK